MVNLDNPLLHALLVACDQSYNNKTNPQHDPNNPGPQLDEYLDSGTADTGANLMPLDWFPITKGVSFEYFLERSYQNREHFVPLRLTRVTQRYTIPE